MKTTPKRLRVAKSVFDKCSCEVSICGLGGLQNTFVVSKRPPKYPTAAPLLSRSRDERATPLQVFSVIHGTLPPPLSHPWRERPPVVVGETALQN